MKRNLDGFCHSRVQHGQIQRPGARRQQRAVPREISAVAVTSRWRRRALSGKLPCRLCPPLSLLLLLLGRRRRVRDRWRRWSRWGGWVRWVRWGRWGRLGRLGRGSGLLWWSVCRTKCRRLRGLCSPHRLPETLLGLPATFPLQAGSIILAGWAHLVLLQVVDCSGPGKHTRDPLVDGSSAHRVVVPPLDPVEVRYTSRVVGTK